MSEAEGVYRGFQVVKLPAYSLVEIKSVGQGPVPEALRGMFTTHMSARKTIDFYLDHKGDGDGKAKSSRKS